MATVGGGAAYRQLQRLPNDMGQALEGIANRQQADKRAVDKVNEDRRIAKAKAADDFKKGTVIDPAKFEVEATNWQDADEIFGAASQAAMDNSIDLYAQARKMWDSGDEEGARALQQQAKRIETSFSNFATKREEFATQINNTRELIKAGKVLTKSEGQFIDGLDRNEYTVEYVDGDFMLSVLMRDANGKIQRDENGNAQYMQRSMNDVRKGLHRPFEFEEAMGKGGMIDNMMVNFGTSKYDKEQDQYIITEQKWDNGNEALLTNYVQGVIGTEDEDPDNREMYKWYKNATGKEKMSDWTQEDKDIVEDYIREGVASQYTEEVGMKIRQMKPSERLKDNEANRAVRVQEGRENRASREREGAANRQAQMDRLKLQLDAKAKSDEAKAKVKGMGKNPEQKVAAVGLYQLAQRISQLDENADESEVQSIIDETEYGFLLGSDLDWFQPTEYSIKGGSDGMFGGGVRIKDVFANFKAFVKASGLELKDTDLKDIMANPEKYSLPESSETTDSTVTTPDSTGGFDPNNF